MHELGVISAMVKTIEDIITEQGYTQVHKLVLEIGELSGIVPHFMETCYPAAVYKTFMENSVLEMEIIPGLVRCKACGKEFNAVAQDLTCPQCDGQDLEILSGNDIMIKEIQCT